MHEFAIGRRRRRMAIAFDGIGSDASSARLLPHAAGRRLGLHADRILGARSGAPHAGDSPRSALTPGAVLYFGPNQGPATLQSLMDGTFNILCDKNDSEFASLFMDDITIVTEGYEADDDILERHIEHCELFLPAALPRRIQFKMEKNHFAYEKGSTP